LDEAPARPTVTVLIPDPTRAQVLAPAAERRLTSFAEVRSPGEAPPERWDLGGLLTGATACLTGWGTPPLSEPLLAALPRLRLIAHTGGSIRRLVPAAAMRRGLRVSHASAFIAEAVAEMVVLQALMHLRKLDKMDHAIRRGVGWHEVFERYLGRLLGALTVGVIGAGHAGRAVITRLRAFGCRVLVYDPLLTGEDAARLGVDLVTLPELLAGGDIISFHAPVLPDTTHMVGAAELELIRDGVLVINTARAALLDGAALIHHLRSGRLAAALDVFEDEPLPLDSELRQLPNVVLSPHAAGHTIDSQLRQGEAMVAELERLCRGEPLMFEIDPDTISHIA